MNESEFELVAAAIKASYPNSKVLPDKYAMRTWYRALADLDFHVVENAVWEHISTSVFPPSIAEIREKCTDRLSPMITDWGEAWEEVMKAIRRYGSYREEEAVASLSRLTAIAVRRMGFKDLCQSENPIADRAHFRQIYEGMAKEERRRTQLPEFVRGDRERMIESNTPPAYLPENAKLQLEVREVAASTPEYVESLVEKVRGELIRGKGKN